MAISVIIGTYNSAKHLREVIDHVKDYDEIIVCDAGSTDDTLSIAREEGCAIFASDETQGEDFRMHTEALRKAKNDWILYLHPDELVTPGLKKYLDDFTGKEHDIHGLFIPRRNFLLDREDTNNYPDFHLRFFHRSGTAWSEGAKALPSVYGRTGRIPANRKELALIHIPRTIDETIGNLNESVTDSSIEARKVPLIEILSATAGVFMREYIMKGKLRYGTTGYIDSVNKAMKEYFKLARSHEKFTNENPKRKKK